MILQLPLRNLGNQLEQTARLLLKYKKALLIGSGLILLLSGITGTAQYFGGLPLISQLDNLTPVSSKILDRNGNLLYEIHGEVKRTPVDLSEISPYLTKATIAIEDKNFYHHAGVLPKSIARAAWANYKHKSVVQGGSTITQQLAKNLLLTRKRSLKRKFNEVILATLIEARYSKDEILEMYLNTTPYGRNTYGVEAASLSYYNKSAKDLTLAQVAYLAALPKAPSLFSPFGERREELDLRKNHILSEMLKEKMITQEEYTNAKTERVAFQPGKTGIEAPHFVKWVESAVREKYGQKALEEDGLIITASLDLDLQKKAEKIIREGVEKNRSRYGAENAALVAMDPKTGEVLAMVGSKDYFGKEYPNGCRPGVNCKFDPKVNAALALRQPGSSFKPYTYVTAFSSQFKLSPASIVLDQTKNFSKPGAKPYIPKNYTGKSYGKIPIRKALAGSLNVAAVRTLETIGIGPVIETARKVGITSPLENCGLSLTLGACEVSLLEHVGGFSVFATNGEKAPITPILKITNKQGAILFESETKTELVLEPQAAYEIVNILSDNKARAFIFGNRSPLILPDRPVAAKTGTTQHFHDGWALGFTPQIATGVWVGNNNGALLRQGADGVVVAAPIWQKFMIEAHKDLPALDFEVPNGIQKVKISRGSGKLATSFTIDAVEEIFADYAVPTEKDPYLPPPPPEELPTDGNLAAQPTDPSMVIPVAATPPVPIQEKRHDKDKTSTLPSG